MRTRRLYVVFILAVLMILGTAMDAYARRAWIKDAACAAKENVLALSFTVDGVFNDKLDELVRSGTPIGITYSIVLFQKNPGWFDKKIAEWEINRTLQYDIVRTDYELNMGVSKTPIYLKDYDSAKSKLVSFEAVPIVDRSYLEKSGEYYLRVQARLSPINLSHFMDSLFLSKGPWDFETPWINVTICDEPEKGTGQ